MRKMIIGVVTIVMLVSMLAPITASATFEQSKPELMIYTQECPQTAISYATQAYIRHVNSMVALDLLQISDKVSLGSPFTIMGEDSNPPVFYFPVINNNKIVATFRVSVNESYTNSISSMYTGILSKYMVSELNMLSTLTSEESIALLYMDNDNVMLQLNGHTELLIESPEGHSPAYFLATTRSDYQVAHILTTITEDTVSRDQNRSSTMMSLALDMRETQGNNNWCTAYASSAIIRYLLDNSAPVARQIMERFHGTDLDVNDELTSNQVVSAGYIYGFTPVFTGSRITNASVISEIQSYTPVYIVGQSSTSGNHSRHAMVISGYNITNSTFIIWNPWYNYVETMDMSSYQYTGGGKTYTWIYTIYDW